jgi:hypothetical protein
MVENTSNWIGIVGIGSDWPLPEMEPSSRYDTGKNKLNIWINLACLRKKYCIFYSQKYTHLPGFEVGAFGVKQFVGSNSLEDAVNIFEQTIFWEWKTYWEVIKFSKKLFKINRIQINIPS